MPVETPGQPTGAGFMAGRAGGAVRSYLGSTYHKAGARWVKEEMGFGRAAQAKGLMGTAGRWLGRGFIGLSMYAGYQEGGVGGAITSGATHIGTTYALGAGLKALGGVGAAAGSVAAGVGIGAAAAVGTAGLIGAGLGLRPRHLTRPWVNEYMKKHAKLEMATPFIDQFGTAATMRQRSLQAINNSKINGRTALGNEASLSFNSYYR